MDRQVLELIKAYRDKKISRADFVFCFGLWQKANGIDSKTKVILLIRR
ncbi:hypothetical protein [Treponema pectinovorum]|nr:hypothetical protein [Treponema pectinovorum]